MQTPSPPQLKLLDHISPSLYAVARSCGARAGWAAFGGRGDFPEAPAALLGRAFHTTVGHAAVEGQHGDDVLMQAARSIFDAAVNELHAAAHPLLRAKFLRPELLPYYYLVRERAALASLEAADVHVRSTHGGSATPGGPPRRAVEKRLRSSDGLLVGQPDVVDARQRQVIDYKTNLGPHDAPHSVSDAEARQLRLYAYLLHDNGVVIELGTVVRANGARASVAISKDDARMEAEEAGRTLKEFNRYISAGATFESLARPSAEACRWCPCLPMCEPFWQSASPAWRAACGVHIEGAVVGVEESNLLGTQLVSLLVDVVRGTCEAGARRIEQIPKGWLTAACSAVPQPREVVRAVHVRIHEHEATGIKVHKVSSALWLVGTGFLCVP